MWRRGPDFVVQIESPVRRWIDRGESRSMSAATRQPCFAHAQAGVASAEPWGL